MGLGMCCVMTLDLSKDIRCLSNMMSEQAFIIDDHFIVGLVPKALFYQPR